MLIPISFFIIDPKLCSPILDPLNRNHQLEVRNRDILSFHPDAKGI